MATSLKTFLNVSLEWIYENPLDQSTISDRNTKTFSDALVNGTVIDAADLIWHDQRTLAATTENIDLAGVLTNAFGTAMTFVKIKGILIKNRATTAAYTLAIGGHATAAFINWVASATDIVNIGPDGIFLLWNPSLAGYAVTATTGDMIKIDSGANSITYDIFIIGTSA